jgi:putative peptidoglycan lipid II flippase
VLPQLSKHISKKNKKKIDLIQNKALELSLFLSLPASIALFIASDEIISALFGYGQFSESSVLNSAKALFYFSLGLPAFAMIKVFSNFFFANHDTKTPFYISLLSVLLNILISVYFFKSIGFIIIPIATTISSWFNLIFLFLSLQKRNLFSFNNIFIRRFFKIIFSSILMGLFFNYLILLFNEQLSFEYSFKSIYLILTVILGLGFYLLTSYLIKAFQLEDIKLKY